MKKLIFLCAALAALSAASQAKGLTFALTGAYLAPTDSGYREVYGSGGLTPGLRLEAGLLPGLSAYVSYNYLNQEGTTPILGLEAEATQHHASLGAVWRKELSPKLNLGLWAGLLYVAYREEALDVSLSGNALGFATGADLRLSLGKRLFAFPFLAYGLARDTVEEVGIKLGGLRAGIGLGIRL